MKSSSSPFLLASEGGGRADHGRSAPLGLRLVPSPLPVGNLSICGREGVPHSEERILMGALVMVLVIDGKHAPWH